MNIKPALNKVLLIWSALFVFDKCAAATDTLRVMTYNVLYYGDTPPCQGPHSTSNGYLETIVAYANPDVIGLEKMASIPTFPGDPAAIAPTGFADSVVEFALNIAYPGRYTYCTFTNYSSANNIDVLFYDQHKLGFAGILCTYSNITDFNTYKLYYRSADLATTHDTIFLYVTLNHTNSGSGSSDAGIRADQITGEMTQIATHVAGLQNHVNMGDFNTHNSDEACYQTLVAPANSAFQFFDPPFSLDGDLSYPIDWDNNPGACADFLTTSTRLSNVPNSCGSTGGGKSWYDHIFISGSIVHNAYGLSYIPHSYRTIGNDGNRVGKNINDAPTNTSAPDSVIEALFQMSNKYPITVDLLVNTAHLGTANVTKQNASMQVMNPIGSQMTIHFSETLVGKTVQLECLDMLGRTQMKKVINVSSNIIQLPCELTSGVYCIKCNNSTESYGNQVVIKE